MARGPHSSDGVSTVVHPRTDFPQQGWQSYVERTENIPSRAGIWESQAQGFRSVDARTKQRPWVLYPNAAEPAWTAFVPVTVPFVAANDWTVDTAHTGRGKSWFSTDYPRTDWLTANLQAAFDPAVADWHIDTTSYEKRNYRDGDYPDSAWMAPVLNPVTNPAIRSWVNESVRMAGYPRRRLSRGIGTIGFFFTTVFDPATQAWHIETRLYEKRAYRNGDYPDVSWLAPTITPSTNPAIRSWTILTDQTPDRNARAIHNFLAGFDQSWMFENLPVPFDSAFYAAVSQLVGEQTPERDQLEMALYLGLYDLSWVHDVIPLVDPVPGATVIPRPIAPIMAARRRKKRRSC